ncbi:MAG: PilZ domain-containing protein [Myxococcota bacterium]|nr:PilZ domain-containing protein [Myxococcota bacterium]
MPTSERRNQLRFDKVFTVYITGPDGMSRGIGRNISSQGLFVETRTPVPLGGRVKITFSGEDGTEMTCLCEVRYQVALAYGKNDGGEGNSRGVGLRIVAYETEEDSPALLVAREKVLH